MSEEEFLARWSRRKQEARADKAAPQPEPPPDLETKAADAQQTTEHPDPDLSSLPPIDLIDATTDITAFLRKGVPPELSRAALRRAWSADPTIRDFVGIAENAWDFNDPNAMDGFGPLDYSPEQVEALVRRIVGGARQASEGLAASLEESAEHPQASPAELQSALAPAPLPRMSDSAPPVEAATHEPPSNPVAPQPVDAAPSQDESPLLRRTHGGALPR